MKTTLSRIVLLAAVTGLLGVPLRAGAQDCATNYTLLGPVGSELSTTTNGYPLLTVFAPLGQCETNIEYDEVLTDCSGSSTNHLAYTVKVGEMFDPHRHCEVIFDQFGNPVEVCTDAYFLTVGTPGVIPPFAILSSVGSVSYILYRDSFFIPLLTVPADSGQCSASVTFDVITLANCVTQSVISVAQVGDPSGNCYVGFDQFGNPYEYCFDLIAIDTEPPVISCPGTITSNAAPGTCASVVTFAPSVQDNCDPSPTVTCTPPSGSTFTTGTTPVTCKAVDASGNTNACTFNVTVLGSKTPVINLKPALRLKDNCHKYRVVSLADLVASVQGGCSPVKVSDCVISRVTSDEPDDAPGNSDGSTKNDIKIAPGCKSVQLAQERDDKKNGRVYKVTLMVKDTAGNIAQAVATVTVPLCNGKPAIDSGVAVTVTGCTP